jgi:uncharacterized protein YqeY
MSLKEDLERSLHTAMKEKNDLRKNALRMALSSIKLAEIESGKALDDSMIFSILQKEIKTKEETIAEAEKANRPEMISPIRSEIEILKEYLPKEMTEDELKALVKKTISDLKATTIKEMGAVMKSVIQEAHGKASNDRISKAVRDLLSNNK